MPSPGLRTRQIGRIRFLQGLQNPVTQPLEDDLNRQAIQELVYPIAGRNRTGHDRNPGPTGAVVVLQRHLRLAFEGQHPYVLRSSFVHIDAFLVETYHWWVETEASLGQGPYADIAEPHTPQPTPQHVSLHLEPLGGLAQADPILLLPTS